ncbi:hypothetical protein G6F60_014978 [Rhizopus arrhizus]|nr:hypothetical protein G6F40_015081 [Rhizopus arrhizus]KAG1385070.1 hypothetical protein G6F60_014978 [Rhizopus arrhizus]
MTGSTWATWTASRKTRSGWTWDTRSRSRARRTEAPARTGDAPHRYGESSMKQVRPRLNKILRSPSLESGTILIEALKIPSWRNRKRTRRAAMP